MIVWHVEIKSHDGEWRPGTVPFQTRKAARYYARVFRINNPGYECRLRQYMRLP